MIDVWAHMMTMERDSIMIILKKLNQASLELHNSSFENITGGDLNSNMIRIFNGSLKIVNSKFLNN